MLKFNKYIFLLLCLVAIPAFAQEELAAKSQSPVKEQSTAAEIETLLSAKTITYAQASRFVLEAANALTTDNPEEAFNYAVQQNWLPNKIAANDTAKLSNISLLLMQSFKTRGGIMYTFAKSPHYAYRELVYLNVIQNRADPSMFVSGEQLLYYVNRILASQDSQANGE